MLIGVVACICIAHYHSAPGEVALEICLEHTSLSMLATLKILIMVGNY